MIKDNLYNRSESHNIKSLSENELVKELAESIKRVTRERQSLQEKCRRT